jgi:hypothetical protein
MKIEHWRSQARFPAEQLDYSNLLGACQGNEGSPSREQHCDTRKGDQAISRSPANPAHRVEEILRFRHDGWISSDDLVFDDEINRVLNLNAAFLKNNRRATLDGLINAIPRGRHLPKAQIERWLREWNGDSGTAELRPFCQVVVYWLRRRIARS